MFGFRKEHKTPARGWFWILNVPAKSESWKNPNRQCSAVFSHIDNINGCHLCDECMKLIWPNVCHKLESILWLIGQVCWLTTEMSGLPILAKCKHVQTMRILQIILQLIQALPFCFDGRPNKGLNLETVALPFYSPSRNNFPRIFWACPSPSHAMLHPNYEQFDFLCIFGPSGCVPVWMYFSILHDVSHSVFCFAMMNLPWFLFCLPASVLFHWNVVRAAKWFLKSFFDFLKWLNHPIGGDLHRIYRIGHLFHMV